MIISHVKIIAFQLSLFCKNYRFSQTVLYIINRKIHGCLEIPDLFLVFRGRGSISKVEGHWPKGALLYMIKIKRFYVVHEPNENF